jgi:hypothetical protein
MKMSPISSSHVVWSTEGFSIALELMMVYHHVATLSINLMVCFSRGSLNPYTRFSVNHSTADIHTKKDRPHRPAKGFGTLSLN